MIFLVFAGMPVFANGQTEDTVTIVHESFTEQRLLGEMLGQYLESKGYKTKVKELGGSLLCFNAIQNGEADVFAEYTGTMYSVMLHQTKHLGEQETFDYVKKAFEEQYGITCLNPMGFNNTYALSVTQETAKKYHLKKISDLAPYAKDFLIGGDSEFPVRENDGLPAVEKAYGFKFKDYKTMDQGLTYIALVNGKIDVDAAYATDGRIRKYNLVNLVDDREIFPPYYCAPIMKTEFAKKHPDVTDALNALNGEFSDADMQKYNLMVDEGQDVDAVAKQMLQEKGLI